MLFFLMCSFASFIIGVRLYRVYFTWGHYHQMIDKLKFEKVNSNRKIAIIITGCTSGIGKETARELYRNGARIIMANRNQIETEFIIQEFKNQFPHSEGQLIYSNLNLSSMESVNRFAKEVIRKEPYVDVLIHNAAVYQAPVETTIDGLENNMQINHWAPSLLTLQLMPKLIESIDESRRDFSSRIIIVTSILTKNGSIDNFFNYSDHFESAKNKKKIYETSKLANLLFMKSLSTRTDLIKKVQIGFASPGFVFTRLHRYIDMKKLIAMSFLAPFLTMFIKTPKQGAQTIIGCAMASKIRSDILYQNCRENKEFLKINIPNDNELTKKTFDITMNTIKKYLF